MNTNDIVLDCCMPTPKKMTERLGFLTTYTSFKHSAPDEQLFEEFTKEGKTIATRDSGFLLHALCKEKEIYFLGKNGHLYYVKGKAELVEPNFKYKFNDMLTYTIHENDSVIFP